MNHSRSPSPAPSSTKLGPLDAWMTRLLWCAAGFNLLAGLGLVIFYHEGYRLIGIPKPNLALPTQLVGFLVMLFGWGYAMVARCPLENANVLRLGWWSKAFGSLLVFYHFARHNVPWVLPVLVLFADVAWLVPFWAIQRKIDIANAVREKDRTPSI